MFRTAFSQIRGRTSKQEQDKPPYAKAGAGMEPAGAERHGQSPKGERAGASESIEPKCEAKRSCPRTPRVMQRRGRESNPRIAVLQTAALPLGYPAGERQISL